jgi:cation transport ATPase
MAVTDPAGGRSRWAWAARRLEPGLLASTAAALLGGGVAWWVGAHHLAHVFWAAGTVVAVVPSIAWVVVALRRGRAGVDLIATLALAGTLAVGEYLAGSLIALMLATGRTLDAAAEQRASRDLRSLLERAPHTARRRVGERIEQMPLESIEAADTLVVGPGEVVPVDGRVAAGRAVLDESALTGESVPVEYGPDEAVRSGTVNAGGAFELLATATAEENLNVSVK